MSNSPSLLTKAAACAIFAPSLVAFAAVPSVTSVIDMDNEAQVANRATPVVIVSWDATDLTAANTANYKLRRSHDLGSTWTDIEVSDWLAGKCYDMTVLPSRSYMYQIVDNPDSSEGDFGTASSPLVAMRYIGRNDGQMFSDGDFTAQRTAWNQPDAPLISFATLAFDYPASNYLDPGRFPDATDANGGPGSPKIGIDFGEAVNYIAYVRFMPRSANEKENRINGVGFYGTQNSGDVEVAAGNDSLGTKLNTSEISGVEKGSGAIWHGITTDASAAYRSYYFHGVYGGCVVECEMWGWTAADLTEAAKIEDVTFTVDRTDFINSYAVLTFEGAAEGLAVQRRFGDDGGWVEVGTVSGSTFTDETVPYGGKVYYRLSNGESVTSEQSFVRMHRITTAEVAFFTDAPMTATEWVKPVSNSFDGNTATFADLDKDIAKLGVDFGSRSVAVAMVRAFPRTGLEYRMKHSFLYGSTKGADEEGATSDKATLLTAEFADPVTGEWSELPVPTPGYYRSYYFSKQSGEFHGNIAEVEFYGWTVADVDNPPLDFTIGKNNLVDFKPVLTWNAIGRAVEVQRADNAAGPWGTLATTAANESSYVDSTIRRYGIKYFYRLKFGDVTSEVLSFRRLRKLSTEGKVIFTNGVQEYGAKENAFDGNTDGSNRAEYDREQLNWTDPKVGVDFDSNDNAVALVRFYPRHEWNGNTKLSAGAILYGSNRSATDEAADTTLATALTEPTDFVAEVLEWQERTVEMPDYYRTYYYQGCYNANMCEVELYGWFLSDIVRPFRVYIR